MLQPLVSLMNSQIPAASSCSGISCGAGQVRCTIARKKPEKLWPGGLVLLRSNHTYQPVRQGRGRGACISRVQVQIAEATAEGLSSTPRCTLPWCDRCQRTSLLATTQVLLCLWEMQSLCLGGRDIGWDSPGSVPPPPPGSG